MNMSKYMKREKKSGWKHPDTSGPFLTWSPTQKAVGRYLKKLGYKIHHNIWWTSVHSPTDTDGTVVSCSIYWCINEVGIPSNNLGAHIPERTLYYSDPDFMVKLLKILSDYDCVREAYRQPRYIRWQQECEMKRVEYLEKDFQELKYRCTTDLYKVLIKL